MRIDLELTSPLPQTIRVQQLSAMFEVPAIEKLTTHIKGDLPIDDRPFNIGLIVGPSGSGKSVTLNHLFGPPMPLEWGDGPVVDSVPKGYNMAQITDSFKSVGFNTIPAWMRPYSVLSNGERFRVELARRLMEDQRKYITIDEFTSVVDRQVAKIGAFAVNKYARVNGKTVVCASCHYDIIDWLQPDWTFEPASSSFSWRLLQGRPKLAVEVTRVKYETWRLFAPFHYMSQELNHAARCFGLFVDGNIAAMCGVLYRPHPKAQNIMGFTRMVCLPDWQGMGLAMALAQTVASAYSGLGFRLRSYPNHPAWIRSYQRQGNWQMVKEPGTHSPRRGATSSVGGFGGSRCSVFEYIGDSMDQETAARLVQKGN